MESYNVPFIRRTERAMWLEFEDDMPAAIQRDVAAANQLWDSTKYQDHADNLLVFASKLTARQATMDDYGRVKNEVLRWGGKILVAGKQVGGKWAVVVGAAGVYVTKLSGDMQICVKLASMGWTDAICQKVRQEGGAVKIREWEGSLVHLMTRQEGEGWKVTVPEGELPSLAVASLLDATKGGIGFVSAPW